MWNNNWKKGIDYPEWGDNDIYKKTISGGYLLEGESPKEACREDVINILSLSCGINKTDLK